eukprot:GHRQ01025680.1.p1 GENE.GHRQ01025680.1~~GHRQ01025680.1.p1  ORF type:complete len:129 (+),score=21.20 GHRQ01025680.1:437-823(+)
MPLTPRCSKHLPQSGQQVYLVSWLQYNSNQSILAGAPLVKHWTPHLLPYVHFSKILEEAQHCHVEPLPRVLLVALLVHACGTAASNQQLKFNRKGREQKGTKHLKFSKKWCDAAGARRRVSSKQLKFS